MKYLIPVAMLLCGAYLIGLPLLFYAFVIHRDSPHEPFSVASPKWITPAGLDISISSAFVFGALLLLTGFYLSLRLLTYDRKHELSDSNIRNA